MCFLKMHGIIPLRISRDCEHRLNDSFGTDTMYTDVKTVNEQQDKRSCLRMSFDSEVMDAMHIDNIIQNKKFQLPDPPDVAEKICSCNFIHIHQLLCISNLSLSKHTAKPGFRLNLIHTDYVVERLQSRIILTGDLGHKRSRHSVKEKKTIPIP